MLSCEPDKTEARGLFGRPGGRFRTRKPDRAPDRTAPVTPINAARRRPVGTFFGLVESFKRSLLAENKSQRTVDTYGEAPRLFGDFLVREKLPADADAIRREHVAAFIAELLAKWKPATAHNRYRALHSFFKWAVDEQEVDASPMANTKPPLVPEEPPEVLTDDQLKRLLKACEGPGFAERRDTAIIRLLLDTGMRRAECTHLKVGDVDFEHNVARWY